MVLQKGHSVLAFVSLQVAGMDLGLLTAAFIRIFTDLGVVSIVILRFLFVFSSLIIFPLPQRTLSSRCR
jgi:hypothetical protein